MAKRLVISPKAEQRIDSLAEDLGRLLGQAQNKAEGWLNQRNEIVNHLESIRETATNLLTQLGHISSNAAGSAKRAYRQTATTPPEEVVNRAKNAARAVSEEARARMRQGGRKRSV
jgi:hypothetical protein